MRPPGSILYVRVTKQTILPQSTNRVSSYLLLCCQKGRERNVSHFQSTGGPMLSVVSL